MHTFGRGQRAAGGWVGSLLGLGVALALPGSAAAFTFPVNESSNYLIIGNGPQNDVGMTVGIGQAGNTNNYELGAMRAPVPSTSDFLDGGSSGGPDLEGNVPDPPGGIIPLFQGVGGDGNVAITSPDGVFNFQDVGVYADPAIGIQCAMASSCDAGTSNSFFNDPNMFPNTFDTGTQTGNDVNPGDADQSTRIDLPNGAGVTENVDFTALLSELLEAGSEISGLLSTGTLSTGGDGVIDSDTVLNLAAGINVIDVDTGGNDFLLSNANLVIDGPAGATAIIRVPDGSNFNISQANVLLGDGGIDLFSVMFFNGSENTNQHFNFDNTIINGVAFWSVGDAGAGTTGGEIVINNAQGCTQLVADKVTLNDVRFNRCSFVPEPNTFSLLGLGLLGLATARSTHRRRARRA